MAQYGHATNIQGGVGAPVGLTVFKTAGGSLGAVPGGFDSHTPLPAFYAEFVLLGTSGHKIGGLSQYNGSHLPSCFYEKMHVSGNARTDKLMLNEHTCIYTSTKQRGNIFSSSVEGNAKTPSHLDTTILFRRLSFISP